MIALTAAVVGVAALAAAWVSLRRLGTGYRVARLMAAAREVSLAEAVALAAAGERRYVRLAGRIASDEEFPDENQRPLVFRRRRLERLDGRMGWTPIGEDRQAVAFGVEDRSSFIAIDADAFCDGLVAVPRESTGVAAELPPDLSTGLAVKLDPTTRVRLRVDQVSAVEHATVAGVPATGPTGPVMSAGLGRPLIVSTVEPAAAMRLLAGGRRRTAVAAAVLIVIGLGSLAISVVALLASW